MDGNSESLDLHVERAARFSCSILAQFTFINPELGPGRPLQGPKSASEAGMNSAPLHAL